MNILVSYSIKPTNCLSKSLPFETGTNANARRITPRKNEYHANGFSLYTGSATGITPRKNANDSNGVSLEFTGITPRTTKDKVEFTARTTPKDNVSHSKFVT